MERDNAVDSVAGVMIIYMVFTHVCQHFHIQDTSFYMSLEHILAQMKTSVAKRRQPNQRDGTYMIQKE